MTESVREELAPRAVVEAEELNAIEGGATPEFCVGPLPPVRPKPSWWPPFQTPPPVPPQ